MSSEHIALIGLAITLLGTVVAAGITTGKLLSVVSSLQEKEKQQDERLKLLDLIPEIRSELSHVSKNHSLIPKLMGDIEVLKAQQQHSREMRGVLLRQSRPDIDEE